MSKHTPEAFMEYFRTNYPGSSLISKPDWHAPKIYAAAIAASPMAELLEACKAVVASFERSAVELRRAGVSPHPARRHPVYLSQCIAAIARAEGK